MTPREVQITVTQTDLQWLRAVRSTVQAARADSAQPYTFDRMLTELERLIDRAERAGLA